jgi:hypothetical protein
MPAGSRVPRTVTKLYVYRGCASGLVSCIDGVVSCSQIYASCYMYVGVVL